MPTFALVDCNNFYVSCERVFQPKLNGRPVLVLSNNDGCVIARSNEVKALGVKMGAPFFQIKDQLRQHQVTVFSSNYALYGDMSRRVHTTLADMAPAMEEYSIDEAFLDLTGIGDMTKHGRAIRQQVGMWTGIPVSIGIGPTKVLAKIANHIAKKQPQHSGVFDIGAADIDDVLAAFDVGDIWGVGRQYAKFLRASGIATALRLKQAPDAWIRAHMSIVGLRTVHELRGISCIPLEEVEPERKGMACTRSFGRPITSLEELREALATYATRIGEKLRRRNLAASYLSVFARTNQFNGDAKYTGGAGMVLSPASSFTLTLNEAAQALLKRCYRPGFRYFKAGVIVEGLVAESSIQADLFASQRGEHKARLMNALDEVNRRFGKSTLHIAAMGITPTWSMRRERLSPCFTTAWSGLARVRA